MRTNGLKIGVLLACLACGVFSAALRAEGADKVTRFNIPAQTLASALLAFSEQASVQISVSTTAINGLDTRGVNGSLTPEAALTALLADTGLKFRAIGEKTYSVTQSGAPDAQPKKPARGGAAVDAGSSMRLAALGDERFASVAKAEQTQAGAEAAAENKGIPEILVKGSRSRNVDIQRTEDDAQPYVVFKAEDIQRSMATNLGDFLKTRLPMNTAAAPNYQSSASGNLSGNQSLITLRGLSPAQTLILVNGRRAPAVSAGLDFGQPDINGIPLSSVERIEVLPSTAGGIYGGGATGGVINIILKNDYNDIELAARYENTFDTDAGQRRIEGNAGFTLEGGRTQVTIAGSYSDSNGLSVGDRDFLQRALALQLKNNRSAVVSPTTPPVGATPNIRSANGSPLVLKAGNIPLNSSITYVPYGYRGIASDNGRALVANANNYNLDLPRGLPVLGRSLASSPALASVSVGVRREFSDWFEAYVDYSYNQNDTTAIRSPFPDITLTLPSTVASNPFNQNIQVRFAPSDFDYGSALENELRTTVASAGATVRLPHSWVLRGAYDWSRSETEYISTSGGITPDGRAALADGRLDPLRDVVAFPLDYSPYYFTPSPNSYFTTPRVSQLTGASLMLAGPVVELAAGPLAITAQVERREQDLEASVIHSSPTPNTDRYAYWPWRGQDTDSYYLEATAPLISARNAMRMVRSLDVQASYRFDRTSTQALQSFALQNVQIPSADGPFPDIAYTGNRVEADQYTIGVRYQPVSSLALRASYGAGILAPSVLQLTPNIRTNLIQPFQFGSPVDTWRRNQPVASLQQYLTAGNGALQPEQSRSWSAGFILTPDAVPGLRLSLDYTRIEKSDEITGLPSQVIIDLEDELPGRVGRANLTAQDIANGYSRGVIQSIDASYVNVAGTLLTAYDAQMDYSWQTPMGAFTANMIVTYAPSLMQQVLPTSPELETAGLADGPLKWRGNGGLTWDRNGWTAGWNMQYYDSYYVYFSSSQAAARALSTLNQGSDTIPHQIYHDLFVKYRVENGALAGSELLVGVRNVFDKSPPILASSFISFDNGFSGYGDALMRRYSISLRKSFR